jgi:hypothetical protein
MEAQKGQKMDSNYVAACEAQLSSGMCKLSRCDRTFIRKVTAQQVLFTGKNHTVSYQTSGSGNDSYALR